MNPNPDPGGQKLPTKIEKGKKFHVLSNGCSLLRAEIFFPVAWTSIREARIRIGSGSDRYSV
jgi:hypothetical protein